MKPELSIIIPARNEEQNVPLLYTEITEVLSAAKRSYEIIYIDDGSTDKTFAQIKQLCTKDKRVRAIRFAKNFKKSAAYMAGFAAAQGSVIITMDADLQDDPAEIPRFLEALNDSDLVMGWKHPRLDPWWKTIPSKVFNLLNRCLFRLRLHDYDCGFKAMRAPAAKELNLYGDLYRYLPILVSRLGYRVSEIPVKHHPRKFGRSKYGFKRIFTGAFDLITVKFLSDFTQRPLHLFGGTGLVALGLGFLAELYVLYFRLVEGELFVAHLPMLLLGILLLVLGVQLFSLGLLGELVSASRNVQRYRIAETLN
ncbi:glycosyltransferase family 2 protein [Candidatus Woesearchaeota archaeon]|nr:glycosyltransferase family 2 protein [Candidatus Woesearchaeota archaeon]